MIHLKDGRLHHGPPVDTQVLLDLLGRLHALELQSLERQYLEETLREEARRLRETASWLEKELAKKHG